MFLRRSGFDSRYCTARRQFSDSQLPSEYLQEFLYLSQMVIVVLRGEVQMVDQPDGLFEPRMRDRSSKQRSLKPSNSIHESQSRIPELGKNLLDATPVVARFVSCPVAQVGGREFNGPRKIVVNSRHPQRLEVEQVSGMLLRRPFFLWFLH